MNQLKTFLLMTGLTVLFVVLGGAIAGDQGLYIAFFLAVILNFMAYWFSDKMTLSMTRSRPLSQSDAPELYEMVQRLSKDANLPMPRLYIMPTEQPNAFATGRNPQNAVISVTQGLRNLLTDEEIEGVLAHELAHIKNRDILISSIAAVLAGALTMVARMGMWQNMLGRGRRREGGGAATAILQLVAIILAPIAALLIRMAISRSMEYHADATAANITGRPEHLASALLRLQSGARQRPYPVNEAASHMFIINPLSGKASIANLFSTHPPIEDRVRRLRER